jgi:hypothetical protein
MRYINKQAIHEQAVQMGRDSKNNMKRTANRLAKCNVDSHVETIVSKLKVEAWDYDDSVIIEVCASRLWMDFCQAEINIK